MKYIFSIVLICIGFCSIGQINSTQNIKNQKEIDLLNAEFMVKNNRTKDSKKMELMETYYKQISNAQSYQEYESINAEFLKKDQFDVKSIHAMRKEGFIQKKRNSENDKFIRLIESSKFWKEFLLAKTSQEQKAIKEKYRSNGILTDRYLDRIIIDSIDESIAKMIR